MTIGVSADGFSESGNITLSPQPVPNVAMPANPLARRSLTADRKKLLFCGRVALI
jgi:hypothetical protein